MHSQLDAVGASQQDKVAAREAAVLAANDAIARGIHDGDTVKLFNARGACLVGATISKTLLQGVVLLPTGAWYTPRHPADPFSLELAGNPNAVTQDRRASRLSQGTAANSCLVEAIRHAPSVGPYESAP